MNVEGSTHKQVVDLIKSGGDVLTLTVISVTPQVCGFFFLKTIIAFNFPSEAKERQIFSLFHNGRVKFVSNLPFIVCSLHTCTYSVKFFNFTLIKTSRDLKMLL